MDSSKKKRQDILVYKEEPFPNFKDMTKQDIVSLGRSSCMRFGFNPESIKGRRVLDAGCGTGERAIGIALAYKPKEVVGIDLNDVSIRIARKNRAKYGAKGIFFFRRDLFALPYKGDFDYVLCEGVLHHTLNPKKGLAKLAKALKKDGIIIIGVYSVTGLLGLRLKRLLINTITDRPEMKEKLAKLVDWGISRRNIYDSYINPVVSYHHIGELLGWFKDSNLEYIGSYYPFEIYRTIELIKAKIKNQQFFAEKPLKKEPNIFDRIIIQIAWLLTYKFMMRAAGRKLK